MADLRKRARIVASASLAAHACTRESLTERKCPIRVSGLARLTSSLVSLVFSFLNLRDHVSLSLTARAANAASKCRTSTPAAYRHPAHLPPSALPALLRPSLLVFVYREATDVEQNNFAALCRVAPATLTSLAVENGHDFTARDYDREEFVIGVPVLDLGVCENLRSLDLAALFMVRSPTLAQILYGLTALTDLKTPRMFGAESLEGLPTSLVSLRLLVSVNRDEPDFGPLSRLTRLESFSSSEDSWLSTGDSWISAGAFATLLASLSGPIRVLDVTGPFARAPTRFVLPPTLTEFGCAVDPTLVTFQFPGALRRARLALHPKKNCLIVGDPWEGHGAGVRWLAALPAGVESLQFTYSTCESTPEVKTESLVFSAPGNLFCDDARVLLVLPCAGALRSLDLRGAHRFCLPDEKRPRAVCDGFAAAFPLLEDLRLSDMVSGVESTERGMVRSYLDDAPRLARLLGLPRLAGLTALDLTGITGVETYTAHDGAVRTYSQFCASADRPGDGLVLQIVEQYPLLTRLALPVLLLQTRVCGGCALLPPLERKCSPLTRREWLHEACGSIFVVQALARLAHLRLLDAAGLGVLPACALEELGRNPPPQLSRLVVADTKRWDAATKTTANPPATQAALDSLTMRGVEVILSSQPRSPCGEMAGTVWEAPDILALSALS